MGRDEMLKGKKIGVYGGSFNPVHFGHTGLAEWVVEHTDLDEVWMMVSPNNPLKEAGILADEQERLAGLKAAIAGKQGLVASDFEFHLPRPSYTANTLRELSKAYPEYEFSLVIGEDNRDIFDKWKESEWILANYRVWVYPRGDKKCASATGQEEGAKSEKGFYFLEGAPHFDISSTEIREKNKK